MLAPLALAILVAHPLSASPLAGQAGTTQQPPTPAAQETPEKPWPPAGVLRPGDEGVAVPVLVSVEMSFSRRK